MHLMYIFCKLNCKLHGFTVMRCFPMLPFYFLPFFRALANILLNSIAVTWNAFTKQTKSEFQSTNTATNHGSPFIERKTGSSDEYVPLREGCVHCANMHLENCISQQLQPVCRMRACANAILQNCNATMKDKLTIYWTHLHFPPKSRPVQ